MMWYRRWEGYAVILRSVRFPCLRKCPDADSCAGSCPAAYSLGDRIYHTHVCPLVIPQVPAEAVPVTLRVLLEHGLNECLLDIAY